jgi:hypothetical protein
MLFAYLRRGAPWFLCLFGTSCSSSMTTGVVETHPDAATGSHPADAATGASEAASAESAPGPEGAATLDDAATALPPVDAGDCHAIAEAHPIEGFLHLNLCDPTAYQTNPPSSGNHYPIWAAYQTYTTTFRPGFWVHNLEHGAVVITYNCPGGCASEVAAAQAFIDSLPADCVAPPRRVILLPNPDLDRRWAASAWGYTLKAGCFDRPAFAQFVADHYGHGLEAVCGDGLDPTGACP